MKNTRQNLIAAIVSSLFGIMAYFIFRHGPVTVSPVLSAFFCAAGLLLIFCLLFVSKKCCRSRAYLNAFYEHGSVSVTAASGLIVSALFVYVFSDTDHFVVYLFMGICIFSITMMFCKIFFFIRLYLDYFRRNEMSSYKIEPACEHAGKADNLYEK